MVQKIGKLCTELSHRTIKIHASLSNWINHDVLHDETKLMSYLQRSSINKVRKNKYKTVVNYCH